MTMRVKSDSEVRSQVFEDNEFCFCQKYLTRKFSVSRFILIFSGPIRINNNLYIVIN